MIDRIDDSEGIELIREGNQNCAIFVAIGIL